MKFYYVYVLKSLKRDYQYIGYSEDIKTRYKTHNQGRVKSTKLYRPLDLIHFEAYRSKKDAQRRELYLKTSRGRTTLKTMLKEFLR